MHTPFHRRTFLKTLGVGAASGLGLVGPWTRISAAASASATTVPCNASPLPRATPASQGVGSAGILRFIGAMESANLGLHSLMVLRHGHVVAEGWWAPYAADLRHSLYSLSKSFTSTAIGMAAAEGRLRLSDAVTSFFPGDLPAAVSAKLASMRICDLLMMAGGHAREALLDVNFVPPGRAWSRFILQRPVPFLPGTHFAYNNAAPYLLSAILQRVTGQTLSAYLRPRLFDPLGIAGADWEASPDGIDIGAWGLRLRTEDVARFGQLYLQKGEWDGRRVVERSWVEQATREQIPTEIGADLNPASADVSDWAQGYGYQFWRCRHDAYRADGAFGQFCVVLPKDDAVIVMTSETPDMQAVLDGVWAHLLPALRGADATAADDDDAHAALSRKLASLTLPLPAGQRLSPLAAHVGGRAYAIAANRLNVDRVALRFAEDQTVFTLHDAHGEHRVACGVTGWLPGETDLSPVPLKLMPTVSPGGAKAKIAAAGAWRDARTFVMHWRFTETAHYDQVTCRFDGDRARIEFAKSLSIVNPEIRDDRPALDGVAGG